MAEKMVSGKKLITKPHWNFYPYFPKEFYKWTSIWDRKSVCNVTSTLEADILDSYDFMANIFSWLLQVYIKF
jgi:hypothetical protein